MFVIAKAKVNGLRAKKKSLKAKMIRILICIVLIMGLLAVWPSYNLAAFKAEGALFMAGEQSYSELYGVEAFDENSLIRFHVIANSDSQEDQMLKYAVRDEILKTAGPILAQSGSLEQSRQILKNMETDLVEAAQRVVLEWGKNYEVSYDYGKHSFPAKSYGTIVLPAGEYEAVNIRIGEARGANWWCVLFPPLCFADVEESTSVSVDGKPAVPLDSVQKDSGENKSNDNKKIRFYFIEKLFG